MTTSRCAALVIIGMLGTALPAMAQNPTFELSAAYQFTRVPDENLPLGFAVDAARNWGQFGVVAEGGWAHDSNDVLGLDTSLNLWHVGAGVRASSRRNARFTPYAQVIAGIANMRASIEGLPGDVSDTNFMIQPGGGVSVTAGDGWAVFGAADYRRVFVSENNVDDDNEFRFLIGLRMLLD